MKIELSTNITGLSRDITYDTVSKGIETNHDVFWKGDRVEYLMKYVGINDYKSLNDQSGCVAVTNIKTGEFYALVSSPSYDPNLFSKSISSEKWNSLTDNIYKPLINKSISSQYPPGSTIKPFVALAALENGVSEKREVYCNGKHEIKDTSLESGIKTFHCWKEEGHGNVNMNEALKVSCDVYFYQISREVGINKIAEVCKRFGFGQNVGFCI